MTISGKLLGLAMLAGALAACSAERGSMDPGRRAVAPVESGISRGNPGTGPGRDIVIDNNRGAPF